MADTETRALRPRLSERALPRLHFVDGRCRVLLHDVETGDVVEVGPREWVLLAAADGTRDVEGILMAASREGVVVGADALEAMLEGVRRAGMLAEGPLLRKARGESGAADGGDAAAKDAAAQDAVAKEKRPIERLPGYSFHCDGHGSCCRIYATVVFSPLEVARARSLRPEVLDGGEREAHAFMPVRGTGGTGGAGAGMAVAIVDGRCAYLEGSLCSLHRTAGADSKPLGCNLFPLSLVDDGTRVRASVSVECACVLASVGREGGAPIVAESALLRGDLDPAVVVDELPASVEIAGSKVAPLGDYVRWCDAVLDALAEVGIDGQGAAGEGGRGERRALSADAALAAWGLSGALEAHGFDVERARAAIAEAAAPSEEVCARYLGALADKAARRAKGQRAWRSERDLCRRGVAVIAASAALLTDGDVLSAVAAGAGAQSVDEGFYLRACLFGHQMIGYPLVTALRDRAVAIWVSRAFPLAAEALYPGEVEPAFTHPLALVEALMRGHGLRRYTESVEEPAAAG